MRQIFIASDHAGIHLKKLITTHLTELYKDKFKFEDLGPFEEKSVDYPDFAVSVSKKVLGDKNSIGILICGSGQGMCMTANKFKGIRAAMAWDLPSAKLSREHNNSNVLCLGSRLIPEGLALMICDEWLKTEFAGTKNIRHENRVNKMNQWGGNL